MSNDSSNATLDFPDYDVNESFSRFNWAELAPVLVVYSLTFFLGLIGNVVIIASTLCPRLRPLPATPTNVFLGGLASADLLLIIFCIPVKVSVNHFFFNFIVQRYALFLLFRFLSQHLILHVAPSIRLRGDHNQKSISLSLWLSS